MHCSFLPALLLSVSHVSSFYRGFEEQKKLEVKYTDEDIENIFIVLQGVKNTFM